MVSDAQRREIAKVVASVQKLLENHPQFIEHMQALVDSLEQYAFLIAGDPVKIYEDWGLDSRWAKALVRSGLLPAIILTLPDEEIYQLNVNNLGEVGKGQIIKAKQRLTSTK